MKPSPYEMRYEGEETLGLKAEIERLKRHLAESDKAMDEILHDQLADLESLRQRCADVLEGTLEIRDHNDNVLAKFSTEEIRKRILALPLVDKAKEDA